MITEQEVIAHLNDKILNKDIKDTTLRFLNKIKDLDAIMSKYRAQIKDFNEKIKEIEAEVIRTQGAISVLIELAAEEENLINPTK